MKIKYKKVGNTIVADIRQFTPDPENEYVRDEVQLSKITKSYDERVSEGEIPNIEAVCVYSDGVTKSGHMRQVAGLESGHYFLKIDIDSRNYADLTPKQRFKERVTPNTAKRSDKWIDHTTIYKQWEEIEIEELNGEEVKVVDKQKFCQETLGTTWKTMRMACDVRYGTDEKPADMDIFNKIDSEGMGVETAWGKWNDKGKPTQGRETDLSKTKAEEWITKPIIESVVTKVARAWKDTKEDVKVPMNQSDYIFPWELVDNRTVSTIISKFFEGIGAEVFTENGIPCSHATANLKDHDWYFDTKSEQVEIKNKQFSSAKTLYWEWNKIKGGWHLLITENPEFDRYCVILVNLEKSDFKINTALMGSSKVHFKDIIKTKEKGKDLFVLFGDAYEEKTQGAQVSLYSAL